MRPVSSFVFVLALCALKSAHGQVQMPRFVPSVTEQFNALSERSDAMGFHIGNGPDPSACRHIQGLVRTEAADGTPYFIVSRSGVLPPVLDCPYQILGDGNPTSNLYIVRMGSRPTHGERMRSNRMRSELATTLTPPEDADTVVRTIFYDGASADWPNYGHPGGMQQVGNVLAVPLQNRNDTTLPRMMIQFLDVSDPVNPRVTSKFALADDVEEAGAVAITPCGANRTNLPCATGHYLMVVTGLKNRTLRFFESTSRPCRGRGCISSTDLASSDLSWTLLYTWRAGTADESFVGAEWPNDHQSLNFLREGDLSGDLYLAGARGHFLGDDYIDLYRVTLDGSAVRLAHVATRHLISRPPHEHDSGDARLANFGAGSAFHVTPSGELLLYATEHDNDGPKGSNGRTSVKMGEWRHKDMVRPGSPLLAPSVFLPTNQFTVDEGGTVTLSATGRRAIQGAWMQMFEHPNFTGRYVVMEFYDWQKENFNDFRRLDLGLPYVGTGFSDQASSWRWYAPRRECGIRANDDDMADSSFPGEHTRTLIGVGGVVPHDDLHVVVNDTNTGTMNDEVTSAEFLPSCAWYYFNLPITLRWALNASGIFDQVGSSVVYSAAGIDGPATRTVRVLAATSGTDFLEGAPVQATVLIRNVAPIISTWQALDSAGNVIGSDVGFALLGQPITVRARFTDPGQSDHQTAVVNWGNGSQTSVFDAFSDASGGAVGQLEHHYVHAAAGTYDLELTVRDDDWGHSSSTIQVPVLAPAAAVTTIAEKLNRVLVFTTVAQARQQITRARTALVGTGASDLTSASSLLSNGQMDAALTQLNLARRALASASTLDPSAAPMIRAPIAGVDAIIGAL